LDLSALQAGYVVAAALLVGFTKTSVGGVGILAVLLMALAVPGKASPGVLLPMLVVADVFAVIYYRRHCDWKILFRIFPATAIGIAVGYLIVDAIPGGIFERVIGGIILAMLVMGLWIEMRRPAFSSGGLWAALVGLVAGIVTMIANAAGPVFGIYLLQLGLNKQSFVGTRSWLFLVLNIFKVPFSASLGLITVDSLLLNLASVPIIFIGAYLGFKVLKLINLELFKWLIRLAALVAAFRLIL